MDAGLDENQTKLGILVLAVLLQVLTHSDSLLDEAVQILWKARSKALCTEDAHNFVASNHFHLRDTVGVPKNDTNLGWCVALLRHVADLLDSVSSALLHPGGRRTLVWQRAAGNALTFAVHTTHVCLLLAGTGARFAPH